MSEVIGVVTQLSRFPVKSMQGEVLRRADVTAAGFVGDRVYALLDTASGKVLCGKTPKLGTRLLSCRAAFVEEPRAGADPPPVRITLPDGSDLISDASGADNALSALFGRAVELCSIAPDDFAIDEYHPDIEDLDPAGNRDNVTEAKLGAAFFASVGLPSPVPAGAFFDLFPVSVMTTATLARLHQLCPGSQFDARRFRMNVVVDTTGDGFVENEWPGRTIQIGDTARLVAMLPDPRCVMTTLEQDDLPHDDEILRTLARHNRLDVAGARLPCAGVYAIVESAGVARAGDRVAID
jgi:uncharacterized protein YcbX